MISVQDFNNWKQDMVTEAFFRVLVERIEDAKETLGMQAGIDSVYDNFLRGFIAGQRDILDIQLAEDGE